MGNAGGVRHYFIEAFTPYGHISLLQELLKDIKHTYFLKGGPGTGKSTMIKLIGIQLIDRGFDVDYIRSVNEPDSVAGLFLPKHKLCLLDKNEFVPKTLVKGEYHREIDFTPLCLMNKLEIYKETIQKKEAELKNIEQKIIKALQMEYVAEDKVASSYLINDEAKSIQLFLSLKSFTDSNCKDEDQPGLNEVTEILSKIKKNRLSFYFLHSLQLDGWLNLAPRHIKDYDRICLEGENSAKNLRDILQEVKNLGQVMEIIVHPLKPYTIIGIVFPERNLAVWKGNPYRIEEQGFIKKHNDNLIQALEEYKMARIELKCIFNETLNFRGLDHLRNEVISQILADLLPVDSPML